MKLIYTSEDRFMVWSVKNSLELAGFECHIRNEFAAGGAGDIAPIETWPEVWLDDESQYKEALLLIEKTVLQPRNTEQDWLCQHCGETNDTSFEYCWNCGSDKKP